MTPRKIERSIARYILVIFFSMLALFPTYWMTGMAFKPKAEWTSAAGAIYWLPQNPTLDNFTTTFTDYRGKFFRLVEPLGSKTIVHVQVGDDVVQAAAPAACKPAVGLAQPVGLHSDHVHIFEANSGQVIR